MPVKIDRKTDGPPDGKMDGQTEGWTNPILQEPSRYHCPIKQQFFGKIYNQGKCFLKCNTAQKNEVAFSRGFGHIY